MQSKLLIYMPVLTLLLALPARAEEGRLMAVEENDTFTSDDDRHYTQGLRFSWLPGDVASDSPWNAPFSWLSDTTPIFDGAGLFKRQYDWTALGQSIFTPTAIHTSVPQPNDRPYGAWLYTGASLLQQTKTTNYDQLENAELLFGMVGPAALGRLVQNDWHQFIGVQAAAGWNNQIHNEPGVVFSYERKWRFTQPLNDTFAVDAIPELGGTLGNIFTYGETSALFRIGHNLAADYGPSHIRPSLSGTGWFDKDRLDGNWGWYLFAGAQGRAVGRNIFLDGNTWEDSMSVDKKPLVADLIAGASIFWSTHVRLDFSVIERTKEFYGQQGHDDRFGSIGLTVEF